MPIRCKNKKGQFAKCSTKTKRVRVASAKKTAGRAGRAGGVASAKASAHVKSREAFLRAARRAAGAEANLRVEIVPGASAPKIMGEGAHYRTSGGTLIRHPGAYSKKGFGNMVYKHTTRRVVVGSEWNPTGHASGKRSTKAIYATTYCNKGHYVATGKPVKHECITIPPAALKAEMEGDYEKAIEIMSKRRRGMFGMASGERHHVQPGDRVTYVNYRGTKMSGRVVMRSSQRGSWVVNTGGRYGTPDVVSEEQIISVRKSLSGRSIG
jgi:hypothetical protein